MRISEIFYSLQGEGLLVGMPSVFIRLAGCPLRCKWCDTKYAWDATAGESYTVDELVEKAQQWPSRYVVITGGEPMLTDKLQANTELHPLLTALKAAGKHITVETAGIVFVPNLSCDLMSISPKLSNSVPSGSKFVARVNPAVLSELISNYPYQLKFVIDAKDDLAEVLQLINKLPKIDIGRVLLMPQATTREELIKKSQMVAELCKQTDFTFGQRLHILLWNNQISV